MAELPVNLYKRDVAYNVVNDTNTVALLEMEGAQGADVFTDSSSFNHTVTPNIAGKVTTDTNVKKFGVSSAYFVGFTNGTFLEVNQINPPATDEWSFYNDVTIEAWINRKTYSDLETESFSVFNRGSAGNSVSCGAFLSTGDNIRLYFYSKDGGATDTTILCDFTSCPLNTWHYVAWVWRFSPKTLDTYFDNILIKSGIIPIENVAVFSSPQQVEVGYAASQRWDGWIDRFRFSNIARDVTTEKSINLYRRDVLGSEKSSNLYVRTI